MAWPDVVIGAFALIAALRGWKRGFVSELPGFVALGLAFYTGFRYNGWLDKPIAAWMHLGPGSAHVVGMAASGFVVYLALLVASLILGRIAKLPVIGTGNAAAGALLGILKAGLVVWAVLYVALFFPLSTDLRGDLRHSALVNLIARPNVYVDRAIEAQMPWFIRPLVSPLFAHHRV